MKQFAIITALLIIAAGLGGCGSTQGNAPAASTGALQTIQIATQSPAEGASAQPTDAEPAETDGLTGGDEPGSPEMTPWPEPSGIGYQGKYLGVAQDTDASGYPALDVTQEVQIKLGEIGATLKIPSKWRIDDPDGIPTLVDAKGRIVGQICTANAYTTKPYFALLPESGVPILWEAPDKYKYEARALTLESARPTASVGKKNTVIRIVALMTGEDYIDENGAEYYLAYCLNFDKAYVDGDNVDYVVSNKTINEIAQSFTETEPGE